MKRLVGTQSLTYNYVWIYRIIGAVLIVIGLYSVLWGKYKESKEKESNGDIVEAMKGGDELPITNEGNEEAIIDHQKKEGLAITIPPIEALSMEKRQLQDTLAN